MAFGRESQQQSYTLPAKEVDATRIIMEIWDNQGEQLLGVMCRDGHDNAAPMMDIPAKDDRMQYDGKEYSVVGRHWIYPNVGDTRVRVWVEKW